VVFRADADVVVHEQACSLSSYPSRDLEARGQPMSLLKALDQYVERVLSTKIAPLR